MQDKYWNYMVETKASIFYLDICAEKSYMADKYIKVFSAIASSTGIAGWVIWTKWVFLWAVIIAGSQIVTIIKDAFPFEKRLRLLHSYIDELSVLYLKIEANWFKVAAGEMTESEINDLLYKYKESAYDIEKKYSYEDISLGNPRLTKKAEEKTHEYFLKFAI